jgi:hypothetical protein
MDVRGFGPVKAAAMDAAAQKRTALLGQIASAPLAVAAE